MSTNLLRPAGRKAKTNRILPITKKMITMKLFSDYLFATVHCRILDVPNREELWTIKTGRGVFFVRQTLLIVVFRFCFRRQSRSRSANSEVCEWVYRCQAFIVSFYCKVYRHFRSSRRLFNEYINFLLFYTLLFLELNFNQTAVKFSFRYLEKE